MSDIAIVGIGCRFAGGIDSPDTFWDFVVDKRDGVVEIPADRWDYRRYYDPEPRTPGRAYTKHGAFMTVDPWEFDPDFFGISPREATVLDPQQRLMLEVTWEALDDAGIAGRAAGSEVGVYVGGFVVDQSVIGVVGPALFHTDMHTPASASYTMLSNRIAYALNLVGPAITVDTACSSSLVAFHLACQALENEDCSVALAGGVNVMLQPETFVLMCKGSFLAADGRCKSFDAAADGYGRGEGAGMVVLKRLEDAVRDGDRIYSVVKATGSNQDGRTTAITVPNVDSQAALAQTVCTRAGLAPESITYLEAHGTGTLVGDPVELRALGRVFGASTGRAGTIGVGSVKATIGHTEAAAGVASVIKAALAIHHRTIPPQGWLDKPNPDIPFDELGLHVQTDAEPLPPGGDPMTIAVNGFGYGGTNAHAILQEYRPEPAPITAEPPRHFGVLPISGRSTAAARALAGRFADLITAGADPEHLAEAAWTRMAHHHFRTGVLVGERDDLIHDLRAYAGGEGRDAVRTIVSRADEPVFVFSGMGPQHWRMGRELLEAGGVFAETAQEIDREFRKLAGWSIVDELLKPEEESRVTSTEVAQPANFLVQVGLVRELAEYGVKPAAIVGHSVGEVSAAYVSGMLSLSDAVLVAYHRARLQATTAGSGGMLAVGLTQEKAQELVADDPGVDIAAINSASGVTLSGDEARLDEIAEKLTEEGVFARRLRVEVPYHSRLMDPILDELREVLAPLETRMPTVPLYSTVVGGQVSEGDWDADYWCANVRQPVRFASAITELIGAGSRVFLEIGPHPVLSGNIREALLNADVTGTTVATLEREQPDTDSIRRTLIGLNAAGVLDRDFLFPPDRPATPHVPVPRYPWQRTRLHAPLPLFEQARLGSPDAYTMLGDPDVEGRPDWLLQVGTELLPWLADHVVNGIKIMPGAAYLDAALSATATRLGVKRVAVEQVRFVAPLIMGAPDVPLVALTVEEASGRFLLRSRSATGTAWTVHAYGRTLTGSHEPVKATVPTIDVGIDIDPEMFYSGLAAAGLQYGPSFQRVTQVRVGRDTVLATVDGTIAAGSGHLAHPAVVDAAMQSAALLFADERINEGVMVPVGVGAVRLLADLPEKITVVARRSTHARLRADVDLLDEEQNLVMRLSGLQIGALNPGNDPLHRMADFYYSETMEQRDPIDRDALRDAGSVSTIVVALGSGGRAGQLASAIPGSRLYAVDPSGDLEGGLVETLRAAKEDGTQRVHVCVVAGTPESQTADDLGDLWTLKRIAVAVDEFANPPVEGESPQSVFGDGSVHATLVTERAFTLPDSTIPPNTYHSALAGARRVLLNEQTPLRWRLIDVEPATSTADLIAELAVPGAFTLDNTDEVLLRDGVRWAPMVTKPLGDRLEELDTPAPLTDPEKNFTLEMPRTRLLSALAWRECPRVAPGAGQIEVRMQVIGLNYKDPLKVIGLLGERELAPTYFGTVPGMEGMGTVVRVGDGVTDVAVGDLVAVAEKGMMRRYAVVDRELVIPVPPDTDPGHCTSTIAFGTAEYALLDLARLEPGETVLIHGAAGGVGTAAIQVAKSIGARIIGTASTDERRAHVLALGADHAVNSRSLNFVDDVMELTGGKGVEVIISSAPGEILRQNFNAAAEFGRIVEVGKADIYTGGVLELSNFDKNLAYFSMDLDRLVAVHPQRLARLLQRVHQKVTEGTYKPLPYRMFETEEVGRAFEETIRSTGLTRIALRIDSPEPPVRPYLPEVEIHGDATYLITGGFGGFGLATGRWLALRGARRLVLLGRSGPTTDEARRQIEAWRTVGVEIVEERVDVTDAAAIADMVARIHSDEHPLRGVFHAAGAVADNRISKMEFDQLDRVYRPKVHGARIVHDAVAAAGIELDMFVLCSSGGTMYGIYGQYSYCSANMAVEQLAEQWSRAGERALCIGWGHLSGATGGMAADETALKYLDLVGFGPIDMSDATAYMEQTLRLGVSTAAIIPTDWGKLTGTFPQLTRTGRTVALAQASAKDTSELAQLRAEVAALEESKRGPFIARKMAEELAVVMGVPVESIDMTVPVPELGLDSLMAVELGARVTKALGIDLMSLQMGRSFSLEQAGPKVAELILAHEPGQSQPDPAAVAAAMDSGGGEAAAPANGSGAANGSAAHAAGANGSASTATEAEPALR
ncbi:acyl transferase domain-containing protein/NADPH:quinone reductase-like Zn-dependent oxidoreductase/NADP-dependent 3-hydroxy acid dehydrogenase YdfG/acyl carrier protein [Nocardia transvalensis]|uniref:Acyl transferase domain-containing protein/NADPH:quinone reductase-like Zn-dependent oxidoreductase/NADP-dependent 3-hydroxy acid dehydrogenase YdfG/acyl carrier protein n=1 Tax=Nocardia transvalensis TaxID=37333 RepID=A0A7W9PKA5_9NOCA|nr:type I polyketide synthase [Nocardia transvalensis]MBB5917455.1 acyl transferase domain-containing protein/NADPH:quinone reductase-like Zn-dependent oxidoreductase/NADP-dependent 3-hydroxy acid dehydrogenase YdfG/acyl carrier protein [Nocardia transvalensis]